jgi:hypothetical protein
MAAKNMTEEEMENVQKILSLRREITNEIMEAA